MKRRISLGPAGIVLLTLATCLPAVQAETGGPLSGFSPDNGARQRKLEEDFDRRIDKANLSAWMKKMTSKPNHVGSPYGKENAEFVASLFRSWGYETDIETFHILFPTPLERVLEMIEPTTYRAVLSEPVLEGDATSAVTENRLPPYNAYSVDGDVSAPLVYVNYGIPEDYEVLERHGIDVRGKIVIARYGASWRGIKPKVAAERGAVGCLIYSDPQDDGYFQGDVYPNGPYRNPMGAQRGSVADMPLFPGDPLTPGRPAWETAERLSLAEAPTLTKIPVLPISYADAEPLLKALAGPVAPPQWRGALPLTYHIGPGPARIRLKLKFDWKLAPAYNVIARMKGAEFPDQWVIRGNHRDAWVFGADDPMSGMVAVMEEARVVGELAKGGWKPRRTLVYTSWDAEEPGLLGSTEWVEAHAQELREKAVAYINSDSNGRGFLRAGGSHSLQTFINEVARDVKDPQTQASALERLRAQQLVDGNESNLRGRFVKIAALGSGSDYTPFLQHLGVASLNISYSGEDGGGSYHSIFDSFDHFVRFVDPGFEYCAALVQTGGRAVLRLAQADLLPFSFQPLAEQISQYSQEVAELTETLRRHNQRHNERVRDGLYQLAADPSRTYVPPPPANPVPYLNFAPVQNALSSLGQAAETFDRASAAQAAQPNLDRDRILEVNRRLSRFEQTLTSPDGLPRRPWFRHQIYAPGFYTGYGVKTLPGVREAIEQQNWVEATAQIEKLAGTLEAAAGELTQAARLLQDN